MTTLESRQQQVFSPHLTDFLSAVLEFFHPVVGYRLFSDDLKRDVYCEQNCAFKENTHTIQLGENKLLVIKVCTSSLMRVRTACFSASLMQMESRT